MSTNTYLNPVDFDINMLTLNALMYSLNEIHMW